MAARAEKNAVRPTHDSVRKRGSSAGKCGAKRPGKSASAKTRKKAAKQHARKRAGKKGGKKTAEQVMSAFKDARISDVTNKAFVASSPVHGKGLFAARRIKADTVLGRLHGMPSYDDGIYVLWITDELGLELTNDLRFINHDKNPNVAYSDVDVTALRDIEPGEELLHDYGW